ncbi:MAG: FHA domain-containing serine/threonine-protein kinase [Eubacteriales bacterium]
MGFCPNCFMKTSAAKCEYCGYIKLSDVGMNLMLPVGTILHQKYLVGRVLGAGGFGVTYLAKDMSTGDKVAIKEYMPAMCAVRAQDGKTITASGPENKKIFEHGITVFNREVETLKQFVQTESIVQVNDSFSANGTSYFTMEFLDGITVSALMRSSGGKLSVDLARQILIVIANTLNLVHNKGMLHRDVSPENILITKKGVVKLIDFGATRYFVSEKSRSLSVVLKAGFAPPEQYSSKGNQGPWTDLYALCATFYNMVVGKRAPDAPDRLGGMGLVNLQTYGISSSLATVIEKGMDIDFRKRYQNISEFLQALGMAQMNKPSVENVPQPVSQIENRQQPTPQLEKIKESSQPRNRPDAVMQKPLHVKIEGTPYVQLIRTDRQGDRWILPKNLPMIIGRSAEKCNIILENQNISRVHCELRYYEKESKFYIKDLSTNGTFIEEGRLPQGREYPLEPGKKFYILSRECTLEVGLC